MGKVIFYEDRNFQGRSYECSSDCSDVFTYLSRCNSCKVENGCFMVYDDSNFMGNQYFIKRGEYSDYTCMVSFLTCSCKFPSILENFGGQMHELMDDCDSLHKRLRMSDCQSCQVMDGHWLMYEQPHYKGRMMYIRPGEYRSFRNLGISNVNFSSARRITDFC
uniref:Beta/gamma crystallin 'Greek key' domain-containing protein n=1 Tax=Pygocentrus nattereri TaxID=42514 RepID=A0A3B4CH02_PYGNA